jgi:hypothetical protein
MPLEEVIELGAVTTETKGVFYPNSMECSTQMVDARDA